jgi:hypothetical protein
VLQDLRTMNTACGQPITGFNGSRGRGQSQLFSEVLRTARSRVDRRATTARERRVLEKFKAAGWRGGRNEDESQRSDRR